jgi:hypothetical protein
VLSTTRLADAPTVKSSVYVFTAELVVQAELARSAAVINKVKSRRIEVKFNLGPMR